MTSGIQNDNRSKALTFIGFGEAARAFLGGWGAGRPLRVTAYDRKTDAEQTRDDMLAAYAGMQVSGGATPEQALTGADAVFSVVTADQALVAAQEAAPHLSPGTVWFDCNSCAPGTKRAAAEVINAVGGVYVDVAVMAPVHPKRHRAPLLVSGPAAEQAEQMLRALDMVPTIAGPDIGEASSIKMLRSVMIKGMEALTAECFLAARRAGVDDRVIASLEASDPDIAWRMRGAYNMERMIQHGTRRAAEMREVARTVEELGLLNGMSRATVDWQDHMAGRAEASDKPALDVVLDRILAASPQPEDQ